MSTFDRLNHRVHGPWTVTWRNHQYIMTEGFQDPKEVNARLNKLWDEGHMDARATANLACDGTIPAMEMKR